MRPGLVGHPVATLLFFGTVAVWLVIEVRQALNRRPEATSTDRGSLMALRLSVIAGAILAALVVKVPATAYPYSSSALGLILVVMWAGIGLRFWSFRTLGHYFTFTVMTSPGQPVITAGPYRMLRHPSYLGLLLIIAGLGLTYGNWLSLAALVGLSLIGFINRIRVEEAALSATLGAAYTSYAQRHKRLIPFVW